MVSYPVVEENRFMHLKWGIRILSIKWDINWPNMVLLGVRALHVKNDKCHTK